MDLRALVVCPDQDSADLLALIQSEMSMPAEHTSSIVRGMELIETQRFDVIVLDYCADEGSEEFMGRLHHSAENRDSMLIAIVEGEIAARSVFVHGANFVLYRPLTSERTRISLRAACGLLSGERRRAPRTYVGATANVAYPGAPEMNAVLADLSESGTLIHTAQRIPNTSKVYFEFSLPGQKQKVRLSGEVAWQDSSGRTGIRFLDVPQASRRLMQTWLEQNQPASVTDLSDVQPAEVSVDMPSAPVSSHGRNSESKSETFVSTAGNRRGEQRFPCQLGAEVYSTGNRVPTRCTLSDISEGGCYVEMPSPLSGQSGVEILVRTDDTRLKIKGEVLASHPGFGMGVRFVLSDPAEREEIMRLLGVIAVSQATEE